MYATLGTSAAADARYERLPPSRDAWAAHSERITISEQASHEASSGPVETSDVRWYRAVGYAHILKQSTGGVTEGSTPRPFSGGSAVARATAAYQKVMRDQPTAANVTARDSG